MSAQITFLTAARCPLFDAAHADSAFDGAPHPDCASVVGIGQAELLTGQPLPVIAAIATPIEADACRHEHGVGPRRQQQHLVDVAIGAVVGLGIVGELVPGLAAILGLEQRALFDRGVDALRRTRIGHHHLGVGDVRRLWERPVFGARHLAQRWKLAPALAEIAALEERGGLRPGIERDAARFGDRRDSINILEDEAELRSSQRAPFSLKSTPPPCVPTKMPGRSGKVVKVVACRPESAVSALRHAPDDSRASVVTPLEVATTNQSGALAPSSPITATNMPRFSLNRDRSGL